mgnify:FL=1
MHLRNTHAIVLCCDLDGTVQEIVSNPGKLLPVVKPGESFVRMISPGSIAKALHLLQALRNGEVGVYWELNVALEDGVRELRFSGFRNGDTLFIGGALDDTDANTMYNDLLRIASEQATALRLATKRQYDLALEKFQHDDRYSELSSLNNELINLQRDLQRKNHELQRLNAFRNELLGMVAHDLRTPLSVISLYSQYLLEETETEISHEQAELVREIVNASDFMYQLVSNLPRQI